MLDARLIAADDVELIIITHLGVRIQLNSS